MKQNVILIQTDCNESSEGRSQSLYNLYTPFFFTKLRLSTVGCPLPINLPKVQRGVSYYQLRRRSLLRLK